MQRRVLVVLVVGCLAVGVVAAGTIGLGDLVGNRDLTNGIDDRTATPGAETPTMTDDSAFEFAESDPVKLEATEETVLSGRTDLEAGTRITVRVQSADTEGTPFSKRVETTVADNGSFAVAFDLSHVDSEREVTIRVQTDTIDEQYTGRVVAPESS